MGENEISSQKTWWQIMKRVCDATVVGARTSSVRKRTRTARGRIRKRAQNMTVSYLVSCFSGAMSVFLVGFWRTPEVLLDTHRAAHSSSAAHRAALELTLQKLSLPSVTRGQPERDFPSVSPVSALFLKSFLKLKTPRPSGY